MDNGFNHLEPNCLVDAFLQHPPQTFKARTLDASFYAFSTQFNLLTTLDAPLRKKIQSLIGYQHWQRLVHFPTQFIGTTVTEYTPLPTQHTPKQLLEQIQPYCKQHSLTIIKDLPIQSPLLPEQDNLFSKQLIQEAQKQGFLAVEGQALAYVKIDFNDQDDFLSRFSKSRRKNFKRKLKHLEELRVDVKHTGDDYFNSTDTLKQLYALYLEVYQQSDIHFDLLSLEFFTTILQQASQNGRVFMYWKEQTLVGYNICYIYNNALIDKYIGLNYSLALDYNLYFISWFVNLDYAKTHALDVYVAGWTDPEVKAQLGAQFTFTQHLVWVKSPMLRFILKKFRHLFESDAHWHQQQET
ncbi:GNAT family N-acetyltransferase [Acinetobacter rathckeae]|uniref:GNAT family N-acetyltransferase n=1 Tax=Acinetobacter rathckeae TaxID=2605272 RepID=UPI0018A2EE9A|nr:GNAT family N-acetyltransferase [Acinetobacter rathckeae]MBF7687866.1 GNAT family N-acetyltransferase [Acinetobacter rathckeae]MBF7687911.1 GNAT family N-acetyltransferase [Acinetobacter rathckeae]